MSFIFAVLLFSIIYNIYSNGLKDFHLKLLTSLPGQLGEQGGFLNPIVGSFVMISLAAV
jgi:ABC-type phosphate transport system permease subunit